MTRTSRPSSTRRTARRPSTRTRPTGPLPGRRRWTSPIPIAAADRAVRLPGLRGRSRGRVREEHPVRARRRRLGRRSGQSGVAPRPPGPRFPDRAVRRLLRRSADGRDQRQARARPAHRPLEGNGGATQSATTAEYAGGERYDHNQNVYYHYVRGTVTGTSPGDSVRVWFSGGGETSQSFTYDVRSDSATRSSSSRRRTTPVRTTARRTRARAGRSSTTTTRRAGRERHRRRLYDVDAEGRRSPDSLGVLSHYDAVVWYTGNDLLTRGPDQGPGTGVARLANDLILDARDFMNEGGKLLYTGQYAATAQQQAFTFNVEGEPPFCDTAGRERASRSRTTSSSTGSARTHSSTRRASRSTTPTRQPCRRSSSRRPAATSAVPRSRSTARRAPTTRSTSTRC